MNKESYSGESLEKALQEGKLNQSQASLTGMVKQSAKSAYISFTQSGCDGWVDLPIGIIERAELIGHRGCREHTHPLMRITLKEPKDPEAQILLALLTQSARPTLTEIPGINPSGAFPFPEHTPPPENLVHQEPMLRTFGPNLGGFGGFGGLNQATRCYYVLRYVVCGSSIPGYPPPLCPRWFLCCPSGDGHGAYCF